MQQIKEVKNPEIEKYFPGFMAVADYVEWQIQSISADKNRINSIQISRKDVSQ
jgi:hypothetical protein